MAKTTNNDIYVVTPRTAASAITRRRNKTKPMAWYFPLLTGAQLNELKQVGAVVSATTKAGRAVTVASVEDTSPGTAYELVKDGETIPVMVIAPA